MKAGRFYRVPVLSGNNHDESTPWLAAFNGGVLMGADYSRLVTDMVGAQRAAKVLREYPLAQYGSAAAAWATVTTDRVWSCTQIANDQQAAGRVPAFARSGNPNGPGRPHWTQVHSSTVSGVSLAPSDQGGIKPVNLTSEHHCSFWVGLS